MWLAQILHPDVKWYWNWFEKLKEFDTGTVLPSGQKLTLGLLATITLEIVPFCAYALIPVLLPFFKCILEVMFCVFTITCSSA
jgi:hypothetical protein